MSRSFPPGGINDLLARLLGARLSERTGQQFVIDNRAGANTIVGTDLTAKSPPDGYTIMIVPGGHAINPSVYRQLPYDTLKDFRGVTFIGHSPYVLAVHPGLRVKNVAELIELAKRKPDQISFSSSGIGNITHLAAALMNDIAGTKFVHVPYKGTGQLIADLMGGSVPVSIISFSSGRNYVKSGKIVVLGVTTAKRNPVMPDLPTLAESGLAGYEVSGWYAFLAPAGTPVSVVDKL
ncbi:MAG: tripartite tricarboxylate transporter substrate-binding protein, partial [Proteobacteria bacterium]|nr:tripartite tricarboxylate transporter substrate-binding protein [Pseudomonadota bacterium]